MSFDDKGRTEKVYCLTEKTVVGKLVTEGLIFDDYLWAKISEEAKPNTELKAQLPSKYVRIYKDAIEVSSDETFSNSQLYGEM